MVTTNPGCEKFGHIWYHVTAPLGDDESSVQMCNRCGAERTV